MTNPTPLDTRRRKPASLDLPALTDDDAERALLGAALLDRHAHATAASVPPSAFGALRHQFIAEVLRDLHTAGHAADPVLVVDALRRSGALAEVGGIEYLAELQNDTPAISTAPRYAALVVERASQRRAVHVADQLAQLAHRGGPDWQRDAAALVTDWTRPPAPKIADRVLDLGALRSLTPPTPLVAGLLDLDTLAVIYGPPGAGKSFVALDLAARVATGTRWHGQRPVHHGPVLYVAAEGAAGMPARLDSWKEATGTVADPAHLHVLPEPVQLLDPAAVADLAS